MVPVSNETDTFWSSLGGGCPHQDHQLEERGDMEKHTGDNLPGYEETKTRVFEIVETLASRSQVSSASVSSAVEEIFDAFFLNIPDTKLAELRGEYKRHERILSLLQLAAQIQHAATRTHRNPADVEAFVEPIVNRITKLGVDMKPETIKEIVEEVMWRQEAASRVGGNEESTLIFGYLANLIDQNLEY